MIIVKRILPLSLFTLLFFAACDLDSNSNTETTTSDQTSEASTKEDIPKAESLLATIDKIASGIDLSKFQGTEIDLLQANKDSLSFVICKATEGITYTDPQFQNNWTMIPKQGFIRGAYHFYRTADDPTKQAENFIQAISDIASTDLPPIVDFEGAGIDTSQSVETIQKDLMTFLEIVNTKLNRKVMIYTDHPTGNKYLNNPTFSNYALWIAWYPKTEAPEIPVAWKNESWTFWQKSSSYQIDHQKNDFDIFKGDQEALEEFIKTY